MVRIEKILEEVDGSMYEDVVWEYLDVDDWWDDGILS